MTDIVRRGDANVRANWGRWVSDCQGPHCLNAWQVVVADEAWVCNLCRHHNEVRWPADPAAIEVILSMRPDEKTRNWEPHETVEALLMENVAHGVMPPEMNDLLDLPGGHDILATADGLVVDGVMLPGIADRRRDLARRVLLDRNRRARSALTEV